MATSLQRQLTALADPSAYLLVPERRRVSIIFTPSEAAKYDRETFYQIGLEGLKELDSLNPRLFAKYFDSILFDEKSKNLERAVASREENEKLDEVIEEFLIALSPYMMLKAPLKCMEWLVHRFHIEKFNIEAVLKCILPYYDTKTFTLVVKVLELEKCQDAPRWLWLVPSMKTGLPVTKSALFSNCTGGFIQWLFSTLDSFIKVHEGQPENLGTFLAFLTSTVLGILNKLRENIGKKKQSQVTKRKVIPPLVCKRVHEILKAMKKDELLRQNDNLQSAVYVIITMLMIMRREAPDFGGEFDGTAIMTLVLETCTAAMEKNALLLVNLIASVNEWNGLPLPQPELQQKVLDRIRDLSQEMDVYCGARLALKSLYLRDLCKMSKLWEHVGSIQMSPQQRSDLLKDMFTSYSLKVKGQKHKKDLKRRLHLAEFVKDFDRKFPVEFSLAIESDKDFARKVAELPSADQMPELVTHAEGGLRKVALIKLFAKAKRALMQKKRFKGDNYRKDKNKFARKIIERFDDDDLEVLDVVLKQKSALMKKIFNVKTLVAGYMKVLQKRPSASCTKWAIRRICSVGAHLPPGKHEELKTKIVAAMVPFLFPMKQIDIKLTKVLIATNLAKEHEFLKEFVEVGKPSDKSAKQRCQMAYEVLDRLPLLLPTDEWIKAFNIRGNIFDAFMANVSARTEKDVELIFNSIEQKSLPCVSEFPVIPEKIHKELKSIRKSQSLSLELVFTTVAKIELHSKDLLQRIFTYALLCSERPECKDICAKFLHELLKRSFTRSSALLEFWMQMILMQRQEADSHRAEYLLIRSLQFLASIFEKLAEAPATDAEDEPKKAKNVLLPIIEEASSPARNTRRSVKAPITPLELPPTPRNTRSRAESSESDNSSKSRKSEEYRKEASDLVELLLTQCVQHDSSMVRYWGLECLKMLLEWRHLETVWRDLIVYVLRFRAAIESDKTQVAAAVSRLLSEKSNVKIHERFVQIGTDEQKLDVIRFGFLELCSGVTVTIFDKLVPHIRPLLEKDPASPVLASYLSAYDGSVKYPDVVRACLLNKETAKQILSKLNQSVFEGLDMSQKKVLFRIMIDVSSQCESAEVRVAVQRTVRKWILDTSIIEEELELCLAIQRKQASNAASAQKGRKSASSNLNDNGKAYVSVDWVRRTETVLEFVQSGKRLSRKTKLIQPLFKLLKICLEMEEQTPVEYLKQLMLTSLTIACEDEEHNEDIQSNLNDWVHFQVDSVIDCLRISRNPQTHHHALILLNYAAKRFPEQVLHGVMSLFTFMGNSILRQDDAYSTQLIQQTVSTIIPTLACTKGAQQFSRSLVSAGIYRVFTSAVQDIPVHRRVPILTSLVEVLGPEESMWQMCFIIVDNALMGQNKRNVLKSDIELARDILWQFPPAVVLKTMEKMYIYLAELPLFDQRRNDDFSRCQSAQSAWSKSVVDLSRKSGLREAQLLINFCLELIGKAVSKFETLEERSALDFETLLEKCLSFTRLLASLSEDKTFRLIANRNFEVIEKINVALEPSEFVRTVGLIMGKDDAGIKKKTLDILNQRIMQKIEWFGDLTVLAQLIPPLLACAELECDDQGELISLVQTAFLSLKLLARNLAMKLPETFVPVFDTSYSHARNKNPLLAASALLCLAELFCLKSLILPKLNEVSKSIQKAFKTSKVLEASSDNEDEDAKNTSKAGSGASMGAYLLVVSGMTALSKLVENLGTFVGSSFLQKSLVSILSIQCAFFGEGEKADNRKKVFDQKLKGLTKMIAGKIPLRNSLVSIKKAFSKLSKNPQALVVVVRLLKDSLLSMEKADFNSLLPSLFDTYLNDLLAYRDRATEELFEDVKVENVEMVEDAVVESLVSGVVLKLAEGTFRPFYHRVFDWATDSLSRKITFYRFSVHAAERLKSLFVTFAGNVIAKAGESLMEDVALTRAILQFFYHIFSNDREGFVTTERFNLLVKPLVDLIESDWVISGQISIKDLNSTIIQLAVATNDLNRWQHLVELLAGKSQHKDSRVRLFTIASLEAIANELEKDFLPLLPPAVPFLADLLGDDDEKVEAETKKMLVKLEAIVGEPLQPYFST